MVSLEKEDATVSKIVEILEPLGIAIEIVGRGRQLRRTPSVVCRVRHDRVAETIVARELWGCPDGQAYENLDRASSE